MKNNGTLERRKDRVFELILQGLNDTQVAAALWRGRSQRVSFQAVNKFRQKYAAELAERRAARAKAVEEYAIAQQVDRIRSKDAIRTKLWEVIQEREQGRTGINTGLVVRTKKAIGSGKQQEIVTEYKIDPAVVELIDRLERSTAEELGQMQQPEKGKGDNINNGVVIYQLMGYTGDLG